MERQEAYELMKEKVKNKNLRKHMLAVEAVMRRLAAHLGQDVEKWGLAGLLHDLDYDFTCDAPEKHSLVAGEMLEEMGVDAEIVKAVKAHNSYHGLPRETLMDHALYAADPLTGLIVAAALIHPEKKLAPLDVAFVMNRFKEKQFARGADREQIRSCCELGLELEDFVGMGLEAMQKVSRDLGL
ncbi:MAG: HDIG domain-containing protein [Firmicutes bacterium]|nr:HDIG domain-containing protein [Bacillota bacterium]